MYVSFASEGFWEAFQKMGAPVCKSLLKEALLSNKTCVGNTGIWQSYVSESQNDLNGNNACVQPL